MFAAHAGNSCVGQASTASTIATAIGSTNSAVSSVELQPPAVFFETTVSPLRAASNQYTAVNNCRSIAALETLASVLTSACSPLVAFASDQLGMTVATTNATCTVASIDLNFPSASACLTITSSDSRLVGNPNTIPSQV